MAIRSMPIPWVNLTGSIPTVSHEFAPPDSMSLECLVKVEISLKLGAEGAWILFQDFADL